MATGSSIEWTDQTWNPTTGCDSISPGCENCLDPDTPVLMADMTWLPLGKISVGDQVVAFTEGPGLGRNRVFEQATVEAVWTTRAEAVEITVEGRVVTASEDHRFLAPIRPWWREAQALSLASNIVDLGMPLWRPDTDSEPYLAGYLAGAIGGAGTFRIAGSGKRGTKQSYLRVVVLSDDREILDRLVRGMELLGCTNINVRNFDPGRSHAERWFAPKAHKPRPMMKVETRRMANLLTVRDRAVVERDDPSWKAGFLAGFFDTDGCHSGGNLRYTQTKRNGLLDATRRYIADLGFESTREDFRSTAGRSERLCGDIAEKMRFLATIQPALARKAADFYGRRFPSGRTSVVSGVRRVGERELVDIQTSSGTFIAAGLATHNCYAMTMARRLKAMGQPRYQNDGDPATSGPGFALTVHPDMLEVPLRWRTPKMVFVDSMSDLFHHDVPDTFIAQVFDTMVAAPQHTFQVLTKRSQRLAALAPHLPWPPNVWMGVSVENDRYRFRVDHLRQVPAAVRFVSAEPLIGPVPNLDLGGIDWVIAGGESGPGARPLELDWVDQVIAAADQEGTAVFVKQLGAVWARQHQLGGKAADPDQWPEHLRRREMPTTGGQR